MTFPGTPQRRDPAREAARAAEDVIIRGFLYDRRLKLGAARQITFGAILEAEARGDEAARLRWTRAHERLYFRGAAGRELPAVDSASRQTDGGNATLAAVDSGRPDVPATRPPEPVRDSAQQQAAPRPVHIEIEPLRIDDPAFVEAARTSIAMDMAARRGEVEAAAEEAEHIRADGDGMPPRRPSERRRLQLVAACRRYRKRKSAARKLAAAENKAKARAGSRRERRSTTKRRRT